MSVNHIKVSSFAIDNVFVKGHASAAGSVESEGPLGTLFDRTYKDNLAGEKTWEQAESHILLDAINICMEKSSVEAEGVDLILSGDLLNQCIASTFAVRGLNIPFLGMYCACSTMAAVLLGGAVFVGSGAVGRVMAATSSHFSSSERQFRTPLQYGGQRPQTSQRTATAAGAVLLSGEPSAVRLTCATVGIINDLGITDPNNMGAAMAPAACDTILRHLDAAGTAPSDYDLILTGDLGYVGSELLYELAGKEGVDLAPYHNDCGKLLFDRERQDVHSGGSGCGCSASVVCAKILPEMERGELKRVLFAATGALLSTTSSFQGESVPGIAHAVELCRV